MMRPFQAVFLILLSVTVISNGLSGAHQAAPTVLPGARVYVDPEGVPVDDAVVVVDGGQIKSVSTRTAVQLPPGATLVDCKGLVIVSGFYNAHVHFTDSSRWAGAATQPAAKLTTQLSEMLTKYGFTTVVDTASDLANTQALRRRIMAGEVAGPRILTAGAALYPPSGVPYYVRDAEPPAVTNGLPQPRRAVEARAVIASQLDRGADIVKLFTGSWVARDKVLLMPTEVAKAAAGEAHARGNVVFAHPSNLAGLEVALDAGVDVLAHAIDDTRGITDVHYSRMKRQNIAMVPTLYLFQGRSSWDILDEVRTFARQGGQILFGTDVGYLPTFDHATEYELMASAGLGWRDILASLTTNPAARFGESERRGKIATGFDADLVVLGSDPALGARAFADVRHTFRPGHLISIGRRLALLSNSPWSDVEPERATHGFAGIILSMADCGALLSEKGRYVSVTTLSHSARRTHRPAA